MVDIIAPKLIGAMGNYAFIDSQNLNLSIRSLGWRLDFNKFRIYLKDKYKIEKAFLFIGYLDKNRELYNFLRRIGYVLIYKPVLLSEGKKIKGNIDAELVLHTMIEFENYDKAILISGDGDFYCLADYLREKNKLLKVGIPNYFKYSKLLRKFADYHFYVSKLKKILEQKREVSDSGLTPHVTSHRDCL